MHLKTFAAFAVSMLAAASASAVDLVIATVNNGHMIEMQKHSKDFEKANPGITLKWVTLEEGVLRQRVTTDIATKGGQFDVMTIGLYEAPIWSKKGWLTEIKTDAEYDVDDLLPAIRSGLSLDGKLYAAPFYGESSMTMYREDLVKAKGLTMPPNPTWTQMADIVSKIHDPAKGVYGLCLRGKPGWGDNMAFLTTMVNTYGGQWFDMNWKPQIDSKPWKDAIGQYVDLMKKYGPPGASANSFNENLALFNEGKCGVWIDATIAASFISDPKQSKVADKVAFAQAPTAVTPKGANWLWSWNLAIPAVFEEPRRGAEVHHLGHLEGLRQPDREGSRLARGADRHAQVDLREPGVPEGREVRRRGEEGDRQREPERQHLAEVAVRRRAVRGDPGVPGDRHRGRPADELDACRQGDGRRSAEDVADRGRARDDQGRLLQEVSELPRAGLVHAEPAARTFGGSPCPDSFPAR